ncbi:MAG TPA: YcaO-like family protein [Isosphaeraceae bacterium]|nr:YcaO-like family protein [Isosphaeraceae bacterium]
MASLKRLIDVIDHLVDRRVGIVKRVDELPREPGAPDFFHYFATACNTGAFGAQANFKDTGGASVDRSLAMAKAIGEAVERYCSALYDVDELPLCSREEADFRCVEPEDCEHYHRDQFKDPLFPFVPFDDSTTIRWTPAVDPLTGETWHVPAALVYMPYYYYKDTPDAPIIQPISTGMACHCSLAEAAVSAVCEVVERDAFTITWQARLAHPQIPVESLSDNNYELVRRLEWTRASVSLFNITLDAGIPTVLAVLSSPSPRTPARTFAAAASLSPETAVRCSLEELAHTRRYMQHITNLLPRLTPSPPAHENVVDQVTHLNFWCDHGNAHLADFLWASKKRFDFEKIQDLSTGDPVADLRVLCERIRAVNHRVLLVDLTSPDVRPLGLSVVRAVIPGFHPLCMGYKIRALGGRRLWEVPQRLGFAGIAPDPGDNPAPHPYP